MTICCAIRRTNLCDIYLAGREDGLAEFRHYQWFN